MERSHPADKVPPLVSRIIRSAREAKFATAKDFWRGCSKELQASYPHYAAVEAGNKFPDIELALRIAAALRIDRRLLCHAWAKDQMPTKETQAFFEPMPGMDLPKVPIALTASLEDNYVFDDSQAEFFRKHKAVADVMTYVLGFGDTQPPTIREVAAALGVEEVEVDRIVEWFRNEGVIVSEGGRLRSKRKYAHLPNTPAFKEIRDYNFKATADYLVRNLDLETLNKKLALRATYSRRLSEKHAIEVCRRIDSLIGHLGDLEDGGDTIYALSVVFGARMKGPKKSKREVSR